MTGGPQGASTDPQGCLARKRAGSRPAPVTNPEPGFDSETARRESPQSIHSRTREHRENIADGEKVAWEPHREVKRERSVAEGRGESLICVNGNSAYYVRTGDWRSCGSETKIETQTTTLWKPCSSEGQSGVRGRRGTQVAGSSPVTATTEFFNINCTKAAAREGSCFFDETKLKCFNNTLHIIL